MIKSYSCFLVFPLLFFYFFTAELLLPRDSLGTAAELQQGKSNRIYHRSPMQTMKYQPEGKRIRPETRPMFDYFSYL